MGSLDIPPEIEEVRKYLRMGDLDRDVLLMESKSDILLGKMKTLYASLNKAIERDFDIEIRFPVRVS